MTRQTLLLCVSTGILAVFGIGCASNPKPISIAKNELAPINGVEFKANKILYRACKLLKQTKTFKFKAEITRDEFYYDGTRVEFGGVSNVTVERPNKLKAIYNGDEKSRRSYFDGKTLSMYSVTRDIYAQAEIPGTIDDAIDYVFETFGFSVPLADLVYANPYSVLTENVIKGHFVGQHKIENVLCDHLVFKQDLIDWQIWIEAGPVPLVRKMLITYKTEEGCPEYEATLSNWNLNPSVSASDFEFTPPEGVEQIEFLPRSEAYKEPSNLDETEEKEAK